MKNWDNNISIKYLMTRRSMIAMSRYEYQFSVDDLDEIIDKINMNILPAGIPEEMMVEVRIREKELRSKLFDDDDDEYISEAEIQAHQKRMADKIEENKRKVHKEDIKILKIGPKARAKLERSVSAVLVRPDISDYVKSDDELYSSEQERKLKERMSRIKSRYQNPIDFKNAMQIIKEYVVFKLKEENKNVSEDELYRAFHNGEIKLNIKLPKLFSDFVHEISDTKILADIAEGNIILKTKDEIDEEMVPIDYSSMPVMAEPCRVIERSEYKTLNEEITNGGKNILTPIMKDNKSIFKASLSYKNMFSEDNKTSIDKPVEYKKTFNWLDDDQVYENICLRSGFDPMNPNNIVNVLNEDNDRTLSIHSKNMIRERNSVAAYNSTRRNKQNNSPYRPINDYQSMYKEIKDKLVSVRSEQALINSISVNNYNPY